MVLYKYTVVFLYNDWYLIHVMDRGHNLNLTRDILLAIVVLGGVLTITIIAPNAFLVLSPFIKRYKKNSVNNSILRRKFKNLKDNGMILISEKDEKTKITLTKKGREKVLEYQVDQMEIKKQKKWDGKWRFVMFDIPEKKRLARDVFRRKLKELGFEKIKNSVWANKYPCSKEIEFLVQLYEIRPYVDLVEGKPINL